MQLDRLAGEIIDGRYEVIEVLGRGGVGVTYRAKVLATGQEVALKELSLRGLKDWKQLDLFEREAKTLAALDHPGIPAYVDYFQVDTPTNRLFYIAQTVAAGAPLSTLIEAGWRPDEAEVRRIALAVLEILAYLHRLSPPIIHRDLKPQNIIRQPDGQICLVDFGAVQTVYRQTQMGGSTVVGTYGYMAPEQFRGQAYPATDLYGLGTTLLFLLTHQSPADLPETRLKIDFRPYVSVSEDFAQWLDGLLEPLVEDRFPSAQQAMQALQHPAPLAARPPMGGRLVPQKPAGSRVQLHQTPTHLALDIPPVGLRLETMGLLTFALFWNGFILFWTVSAISVGAPLFAPLFSIPFWIVGLGLLGGLFNNALAHSHLEINARTFSLERKLLGWTRRLEGNTADLEAFDLNLLFTQNGRRVEAIVLREGITPYRFGTGLDRLEKVWLVDQLNAFLQRLPTQR